MAFVIASDIAVRLAWGAGLGMTLVSAACIGYMFALRWWAARVRARASAVAVAWEEKLYEASFGDEPAKLVRGQEAYKLTDEDKKDVLRTYIERGRFDPVEPLAKEDLPHFLYLWNYLHESLRGNSKEFLNQLATRLEIDRATWKMLRGRKLREKLIAVNTFGNLRVREAYDEIERLTHLKDPIVSLWSWRALLRIDFDETIENHFAMIAERADWSPTFVAKVLLECDKDLLADRLVALVEKCWLEGLGERQMARLISYLGIVHVSAFSPLIHRMLCESDKIEVVIACLRLVRSDESLARVRELIDHERWEIRLQVVQTLGRLGHDEDVPVLVDALNDLDWWVRYRAATALVAMPAMSHETLAEMADELPNEFARDMLRQVLTENRLLCFNPTLPIMLSK